MAFLIRSHTVGKAERGFRINVVFGRDGVKLPKIGWVRYRKHKKLRGKFKMATVIKDGAHWYVCVSSEITIKDPVPLPDAVGIDVGVAIPFMTSDGEMLPFERTPEKLRKRDKRLQRARSRCKRGSRRRLRATARMVKVKRRIAYRRKSALHRITTDLARRYGAVAIEDLRVANMTRSAKGTVESPGTNVRAKAGLNREMLDVSPGTFRLLLEYKVAAAGGRVIAVDPKNTSRTCHECGHVDKESRRSQAIFECTNCGHADNADVNAARNILMRAIGPAAVVGRRKTPSESHQGPATSNPVASPIAGRDHTLVFSGGNADKRGRVKHLRGIVVVAGDSSGDLNRPSTLTSASSVV